MVAAPGEAGRVHPPGPEEGGRPDVPCTVLLVLEFPDPAEASRIAEALEPDNEGFLESSLGGKRLRARARAGSIPSLLHTLDDYLACLGVAERAARPASPTADEGKPYRRRGAFR